MNKTLIKRYKGHKLTKVGTARWAFAGKDGVHRFHTVTEMLAFIDARVKSNVKILQFIDSPVRAAVEIAA